MTGTAVALHLTVLLALCVGLPVTWHTQRHPRPTPQRPVVEPAVSPGTRPWQHWYHSPGWWLLLVTLALVCNQVLFTVYVLRIRHGDLADLRGAMPSGWFELADQWPIGTLATHLPAPQLLSVTALRVSSMLELPFGLLAYLTVVNWLDPRRYRTLTTPTVVVLACASYTVTFSLIEVALPTAYTTQNLVIRAVSGVLCALGLIHLGRHPATASNVGAPRGPVELLLFAMSTAALGWLVLACYDTVLIYSLGRLPAQMPGILVAAGVLAASRTAASRLRNQPAQSGAGIDTLVTALSWWLILFFIPALAIRYELGFGSWKLAVTTATLIILAAAVAALHEVNSRLAALHHLSRVRWVTELGGAAVAALAVAGFGLAVPTAYPETRILLAAALFTVTATGVCAWFDRLAGGRRLLDRKGE